MQVPKYVEFGYASCSVHVQRWMTVQRGDLVSGACVLQLGVSPLEPAKKTTMVYGHRLRSPSSQRMDADSQVCRADEVMFARRDRGRVYTGGVAGQVTRSGESTPEGTETLFSTSTLEPHFVHQ
jgi:hypothetical protein